MATTGSLLSEVMAAMLEEKVTQPLSPDEGSKHNHDRAGCWHGSEGGSLVLSGCRLAVPGAESRTGAGGLKPTGALVACYLISGLCIGVAGLLLSAMTSASIDIGLPVHRGGSHRRRGARGHSRS